MPKTASPVKPRRPTPDATRGVSVVRSGASTANYAVAEKVDPNKPLTDKQREFVKLWAAGESITTASTRAGYETPTIGYRITRMPNALKLYEEEKALWLASTKLTRGRVLEMMEESYDLAKLMSEPHAMVSAAKEIGKILGFYEPVKRKVEINFTGNARLDQMNTLSNEELAKLVMDSPESVQQTISDAVDEVLEDEEGEDA